MSSTPNVFLAKDSWQTPRNARTLRAYMALRNQEIAERLKELRASKGNPPQKLVAAKIGIEPRTLQTWEAGDAKPSYRNLEPLARFYGVSEEFILTGTENSEPESPVVVSTQMDEGFAEFRQHVADIRRDIAEREDIAAQEREGIRALLAQQTQILADIGALLARQEAILLEMSRVADGLPDDDNLRMLNEAAQELTEVVQRRREARSEPSSEQADARRRQVGG